MPLPDEAGWTAKAHAERGAEEYQAGYEARLASASEYRTATASWRAGWREADRELTARERQQSPQEPAVYALSESPEDGGLGRRCCVPFDEGRNEDWKRNWIQADVELGSGAGKRGL